MQWKSDHALLWAGAMLALLEVSRQYSYLLFHSLAELFSVFVMLLAFAVVWNCRSLISNGYIMIIGCGALYIALIDLFHTLAFPGMGVFAFGVGNLAPQLWLAGRYMECFALLGAVLWGRRKCKPLWWLSIFGAATAALLLSILYWRIFPDCFVEGTGLTSFKIGSEYAIAAVFSSLLYWLIRKRDQFEADVFEYLSLCLTAMVARELIFTGYVVVSDFWNYLGHILKLISFYCLYRAIIVVALQRPYLLLWRDLHKSEEMLRRSNEELEMRVQARTEEIECMHEELKQSELRYRYMAYHDTLTGLPNWLWLLESLQEQLQEKAGERSGVLFQVDIRNFKMVNDTFGHAAGDEVLRQLAEGLKALIGTKGIVVRGNGHQFIVQMPGAWSDDVSTAVARGILQLFDLPFTMTLDKIYLNGFVGIAAYPQNGVTVEELLKNLDIALNYAKQSEQQSYCFFDKSLWQAAEENLQLTSDLREALQAEEFLLFYQPKVEVASGRVTGFEALVRWKSGKHGWVMPGAFIPVAEKSGLIVALGTWILQTACVFAKGLQDAGYKDIHVAVNISARQLMQEDFVQQVQTIIGITQVAVEYIELEITESLLMGNVAQNVAKLQELRELGLRISLDDFGTGYSSLTYLKRLPIHTLKLDREFIRDAAEDRDSETIIGTLIALAHEMGLTVVAEGVEESWQEDFLREKGCDQLQGYLFSKPLPEAAALEMIEKERQKSQ